MRRKATLWTICGDDDFLKETKKETKNWNGEQTKPTVILMGCCSSKYKVEFMVTYENPKCNLSWKAKHDLFVSVKLPVQTLEHSFLRAWWQCDYQPIVLSVIFIVCIHLVPTSFSIYEWNRSQKCSIFNDALRWGKSACICSRIRNPSYWADRTIVLIKPNIFMRFVCNDSSLRCPNRLSSMSDPKYKSLEGAWLGFTKNADPWAKQQ